MSARTTRIAAAMLAFATCLALGGCEGQLPTPTAGGTAVGTVGADGTAATATPDLSEDQEATIRASILDVYDAAIANKTVDGLDARVTGPALDIASSRIAIAQRNNTDVDRLSAIPDDIAQTVIPTDSGWPRDVVTITTTTEDQQSKRLLVMTQADAHANYKLWGVARLFSGAQLPSFNIPSIGAQMGTAKDDGLIVTPEEAVRQYADVLANGTASQYAADFADDQLRQALVQETQNVQQGIERNHGTQQQTFTPVEGAIHVMRSPDGGDLVVAQLTHEWIRQAGEGRESQPASDDEKALFGDTQATSSLKATRTIVVALYVPAENSGQQITAVGADRQVVKVEAL